MDLGESRFPRLPSSDASLTSPLVSHARCGTGISPFCCVNEELEAWPRFLSCRRLSRPSIFIPVCGALRRRRRLALGGSHFATSLCLGLHTGALFTQGKGRKLSESPSRALGWDKSKRKDVEWRWSEVRPAGNGTRRQRGNSKRHERHRVVPGPHASYARSEFTLAGLF